MPRSPRTEYKKAFYHLMNRGRNRENIFHNEKDSEIFINIINQANEKFDFEKVTWYLFFLA